MDKICPRCGTTSSQRKFAGTFCVDCYSSRVKLEIPKKITLKQCRTCAKVWARRWIRPEDSAIAAFIISKCKGPFSNARVILGERPRLTFIVEVQGSFIELNREFELAFESVQCPVCSRLTGGYYEAIVQLRGEAERMPRIRKRLERKLGKKTAVSKVEELREGVDLYMVSKKETAEALSELGLTFTISNKLFGVRDGQRVYRTTFCVRL